MFIDATKKNKVTRLKPVEFNVKSAVKVVMEEHMYIREAVQEFEVSKSWRYV